MTEVDKSAIHDYLTNLFTSNKTNIKAVDLLCRRTQAFGANLESESLPSDVDFLKTTIKGVTLTDLLSEEKNAILKPFSSNKEVLSEI